MITIRQSVVQQAPGAVPAPMGLQRKCACGQHTTAGSTCDTCRRGLSSFERPVARDSDTRAMGLVTSALASSSGEPLPDSVRRWMQPHIAQRLAGAPPGGAAVQAQRLGPVRDDLEVEADRFAELASRPLQPGAGLAPRSGHAVDLSAVRVHTGDRAAQSARAVNALAYTVGNRIAFAHGHYNPETAAGRRLLAHELAHVAQQSRPSVAPSVRRYTQFTPADQTGGGSLGWKHPAGKDLRVSDDGVLACEDNGWGAGLSRRAWTVPGKIAESNAILSSQGSRAELRLKGGGQAISGKGPETKQDMTLEEFEASKSGGGTLDLISDCGHACRQVTGSGPAGKKDVAVVGGGTTRPSGTLGGVLGGIGGLLAGGAAGAGIGYKLGGSDPDNQMRGLAIGAVIGGIGGLIGGAIGGSKLDKKIEGKESRPVETLTPRTYHAGDPNTPEEWSEELFKKEFGAGLTRQEAYEAYANLSEHDRDNFDRKYRINKYAVPKVGQGITLSTEKDMPGYAPVSGFTWNFHYAANIMSSGHDYITLESAAGWPTTGWILFMYGPESKKQSFYEFQGATGTHGSKYSALVVQPEP